MLTRKLYSIKKIQGGDGTIIREIFHPKNDPQIRTRYSLAHAILPVGQRSKRHRMKNPEVCYFLNGEAEMHIDDEVEILTKNDAVYIPGGTIFFVKNIGKSDLEFLCITDPAWSEKEEEILE